MALKRQHRMTVAFSMASMTDIIFLLLIFFMVTSTFVFPTGLEVNLPQSSQSTAIKPGTKVYIDKEQELYASFGDSEEPQPMTPETLVTFLSLVKEEDPEGYVALYADEEVPYGKIVEVLNMGSALDMKMVLATKPVASSSQVINQELELEPEP